MLERYTGSCAPAQGGYAPHNPLTPIDMYEAALWWYERGLNVVDMWGKHPSIKWGPYQTKRVTLTELHAWRGKLRRGIGVVCGAISNLVAVDFDDAEIALALLREWERLHGTISTRTILSGSGRGLHLHFAYPTAYEVRNRAYASIKTDIRATGGYIVLPPSLHKSGNRYRLLDETVLGAAELPDGFLEFLEAKAGAPAGRGKVWTAKPVQAFAALQPPPDHVLAQIAARPPRPSAAIPATASFDLVLRRCEQMRHFWETGCSGEHEEPAWKGAAGVLAWVMDGERIFHERSKQDRRYDKVEAQAKFDTRKELDGPTTCNFFASLGNGRCAGCTWRSPLLRSPVQLGEGE